MRVHLVAYTEVRDQLLPLAGWIVPQEEKAFHLNQADVLAEFAGRLCYQSWHRPNPNTATNAAYLEHILAQRHHSVLEHASFSFYVEGVSRSLLAELTRHRHLSFSVLSQRFVDESNVDLVVPPALRGVFDEFDLDPAYAAPALAPVVRSAWDAALETYGVIYERLVKRGLPRKQAREAARAVLPNATETRLLVTGNVRAWREFIEKRNTPHAEAEIRLLAAEILEQLTAWAPNCLQDLNGGNDGRTRGPGVSAADPVVPLDVVEGRAGEGNPARADGDAAGAAQE